MSTLHIAPTARRTAASPSWRAADLDLEAQINVLGDAEIADLDAVVDLLKATDQDYLATQHNTLPLPRLDATLAKLHAEVRDGVGFVLLRGLPVDRHSKNDVRAMAWTIATRFGNPVSQNAKGAMVADVMDVIKGASSPRGYHSNAELRLHTDPASDLIGLCCIEAAKEGGDSMLSNALAVHDHIKATRPDLLDTLYEGFLYHRFGEGLAGDPEITEYKVPLLSVTDGKVNCRYGSNRIRGAVEALGQPLTPQQVEAITLFRETAASPEFSVTFRMQPGDFLLANNLTLLHARTNFVDNDDPLRPRHLLRFWLEGRDFRPVAPELNFFNRGRCGILPKEPA